MNEGVSDQRIPAGVEPRLLRFTINGKACYALKWRDEWTEHRREVNYVLREPASDEIHCLLVDGPLRIAGFPELVSVQATGRTLVRAGTVWEFALTVWECGATDDEGLIRFCPPESFRDRSQYLRDDLKRMIREYRAGTRECHAPTVCPRPSMTPPSPTLGDPAAAVLRELAPVLKAATAVTEALRTATTHSMEKQQLVEENATLREANTAPSEEFIELVREFVRALSHPQSIIFDLRWNRHLSQDRIVAELRRLKIHDCRTKKRVGEHLREIIALAKAKGYTLSQRVTGPQPPDKKKKGYDEATDGSATIETRTAVDELADKEDRQGAWGTMKREEKLTTLESYRKAPPAQQETMRKFYGPLFTMELKKPVT
jgi:hypothetical protein